MAYRVSFSAAADRDLDEILLFLSPRSLSAATRLLEQIQGSTARLADHAYFGGPFLFSVRTDLRKISVPPYLLIYRVTKEKVQIVRILHGSRDLTDPDLFEGSNDVSDI
jgi:toxin ParE1/3/4